MEIQSIFYYDDYVHEVQTNLHSSPQERFRSLSEWSFIADLQSISGLLSNLFCIRLGSQKEEFVKKTKDEKASDGWKGTKKEEIHFDVVDFGESCIKLVRFYGMIPEEKSTWNMILWKQHWKGDHSSESQVLSSIHNL